jgi:asparagine synthase (glutamine-hydrolysing)
MCGIVGLWGGAAPKKEREALVGAMAKTLTHRGPDHQSAWAADQEPIALGHARLSIIDLSTFANQPFFSEDGRYALVYNGELYNYRALRSELRREGWQFHTESDTEVMAKACEAWGVSSAVRRFAGMFAFALWDNRAKRLTLSRDRLGIKPLYFGTSNGVFLFASELKPFFLHPAFVGRISEQALAAYFRYCYVPAPFSIFESVHKLEPGWLVHVDTDGHLVREQYWNPFALASAPPSAAVGVGDVADAFERIATTVIGEHLVADVPLGAFLSGGIDSSLVVALAQRASPQPVRTFSIGFKDTSFDEAPYAKAVAKHLGCEHTEAYVDYAEALSLVAELSTFYDEPFADSSQIPTLMLSRLTRQHVTVALSGDGGDELFAGYDRYYWMARLQRLESRIPSRVVAWIGSLPRERIMRWATRLLAATGMGRNRATFVSDGAAHLARMLGHGRDYKYLYQTTPMSVATWRDAPLLRHEAEPRLPIDDEEIRARFDDRVEWMQFIDLLMYLPDDILQKVDRASMAASLEARVPLLDHRLVEFSWTVPQKFKFDHGVGKVLLRKVLSRYLPRSLIDRPKHGFSVPLAAWLTRDLRDWAESLMVPELLARDDLLLPDACLRLWRNFLTGQASHTQSAVWALLMFLDWRRRYGY